MSTPLDKQLKGSNFCWMDCSERKAVIHPETCVKQVKITDNSDSTLEDWILRTSNNDEITDSMSSYTGLLNWLQTNYPVSGGSSTVSPATATTLGVIKTGENNPYLNLSNGVLTFNTDNLPTAAIGRLGNIKMGTSSIIQIPFSLNETDDLTNVRFPIDLGDSVHYAFPLRYDNNGRTGIAIPKSVFTDNLVQPDWEVDDNTNPAYIKNKPVLAAVATSGNYNDLNNIPSNINFHSLAATNLPNSVVNALKEQIALRKSDTNVFKYASPLNINILDPIYTSVSDKLFSVINEGLEKLYDGNPSYVYCELNIKFTVSNEDAPNRVFSGDLYLTGSQSFTCINNTGTIDIATISYKHNSEDNKDYLKVIVNNRGRDSIVDCNLNIILSRAGANWQANVCLTTLPHTVLPY